jgi:hypothetical protein
MNLASFFFFFLFAAGKHTCEGLNVCGFGSEIPAVQPSQQLRTRALSSISHSLSLSHAFRASQEENHKAKREEESDHYGPSIVSSWMRNIHLLIHIDE